MNKLNKNSKKFDVVIIGSGLAGLTAAAYLSRTNLNVLVLEKSNQFGGRARTKKVKDKFLFNMGAHALYSHGAGVKVLNELEVKYSGNKPNAKGFAIYKDLKYKFPSNFGAMISTRLLSMSEKFEYIKLMVTINKLNVEEIQNISLYDWCKANIKGEMTTTFFKAIGSLSTYCNSPKKISAGVVIYQIQKAISGGVIYLDDGWQSLIEGLYKIINESNTTILANKTVKSVEFGDSYSIYLNNEEKISTKSVILAIPPVKAYKLLQGNEKEHLQGWLNYTPIKAACYDVALKKLPVPNKCFALDIEKSLYLSSHTPFAKLTSNGESGEVVHLIKYLGETEEEDREKNLWELQNLLESVQPKWKEHLIYERFLPSITVSHNLPTAAQNGFSGRQTTSVEGWKNLYVAGDWVGNEGLLADASFASAKEAAKMTEGHSK